MAGLIVVLVLVALVVIVILKSIHSIGVARGRAWSPSASAFRKLRRGQPDRVPRRGRLPGRAAHARAAVQALADLRREEVPVGAGAGRRDRRRHRAGRRAAADRRQERACTGPSSATSPTSTASSSSGGQKGVQRPVLPPGTLVPIHPVAFLVLTAADGLRPAGVARPRRAVATAGTLTPESFGLSPDQLRVVVIAPDGRRSTSSAWSRARRRAAAVGRHRQPPRRLRRHRARSRRRSRGHHHRHRRRAHRAAARQQEQPAQQLPGLPGVPRRRRQDRPAARPAALRRVPAEPVPRARRPGADARREPGRGRGDQGASSACRPLDTSGAEFKFGSIVRPGHRGIWQEPLRTGKYPINPRVLRRRRSCPTFILTLNWAEASSEAHDLDAQLSSIVGKSREGFVFRIDLQVQIHVPDTKAPKVISMVGTMRNLVSEVLQSAVGNHFRNTLQALEAITFIETRQRGAGGRVRGHHRATSASTRWRPRASTSRTSCSREELVVVLTQREIANQEKATFEEQQRARDVAHRDGEGQGHRRHAGAARERAGRRGDQARTRPRRGEPRPRARRRTCELTGRGRGARRSQAIGLAEAKATEALGVGPGDRASRRSARRSARAATAIVAVANAVAEGHITVVPEVLVTGGGGGSLDGLAATLMRHVHERRVREESGPDGSGVANGVGAGAGSRARSGRTRRRRARTRRGRRAVARRRPRLIFAAAGFARPEDRASTRIKTASRSCLAPETRSFDGRCGTPPARSSRRR